jgi:hypothetical protein
LVGALLEESVKRIFNKERIHITGVLAHADQISESEEIGSVAAATHGVVRVTVNPWNRTW